MSGRRVVVTGGAGFIGSHVVDRLVRDGADVRVIDDLSRGSATNVPDGIPLARIDVATTAAVKSIVASRPDAVVHCAAQTSVPVSFDDPIRDARSNVLGSLSVIEGCRQAGVPHLIYVTTGGALYGRPMVVPWNEQAAVNPISPYGISKWIVESYLGVLAPASAVTILRLSNIYGPRQGAAGEAGVVATFLDRMQRGLPVEIHGDGEQTRDLLYVGDAVDAIQAALGQRSSGTFNIGTGLGTTVNALFKQMAELLRYTLQPAFGPERVGDIRESVLDPTHALSTLGWRPRTSLRSGLSMTIAGFVKSSVDR